MTWCTARWTAWWTACPATATVARSRGVGDVRVLGGSGVAGTGAADAGAACSSLRDEGAGPAAGRLVGAAVGDAGVAATAGRGALGARSGAGAAATTTGPAEAISVVGAAVGEASGGAARAAADGPGAGPRATGIASLSSGRPAAPP